MKCTIKNTSPQTVGIFARINGADKRFQISPGQEMVADNYETRIMKIYKKKGMISITPYVEAVKVPEAISTMEDVVNPNNDEVMDNFHTTETHEVVLTEGKTLEQVEEEVEQYVEDGYIKGAWTEEDITFLKKNYPTKGRKYCSNSLNRNESSVQKKINSMGLKKKKKKK